MDLKKPKNRLNNSSRIVGDGVEVEGYLETHGARLLAHARRHSDTSADAEDAYQYALEQLLTKAPALNKNRLTAWLFTVIRNQALTTRRSLQRLEPGDFEAASACMQSCESDPQERLIDAENFRVGREALHGIQPNALRCLLLRADGTSLTEISEITGFSYRKVNRLLVEGRRAHRENVEGIEAGRKCDSMQPILSLMADGAATARARSQAELHIEYCVGCQATLRAYIAAPRAIAILVPLGPASAGVPSSLAGDCMQTFNSVWTSIQERATLLVPSAHFGAEITVGKKIAIVTMVASTLASGGAALHEEIGGRNEFATENTQPGRVAPTVPSGIGNPTADSSGDRNTEGSLREASTEDATSGWLDSSAKSAEEQARNSNGDLRETGIDDPESAPASRSDEAMSASPPKDEQNAGDAGLNP